MRPCTIPPMFTHLGWGAKRSLVLYDYFGIFQMKNIRFQDYISIFLHYMTAYISQSKNAPSFKLKVYFTFNKYATVSCHPCLQNLVGAPNDQFCNHRQVYKSKVCEKFTLTYISFSVICKLLQHFF